MWSGPRNISTALLRAWENRPDAAVVDEPLYAYYLHETGLEHPGRAQILEADETDWRAVVRTLTGPVPRGRSIWYQKHMAHHLLPHVDRGWLDELDHAFLIRDPREMLISLDRVTPNPRLDDTGLPQQIEILEHVERRTGKRPPILDSRDVLEAPEPMLRAFCAALELDFLPEMLSWPPGRRDTDGVWAPHWYANVERSTGFARYVPRDDALPEHLKSVYEQCLEPYGKLHELRLRP
ncbi:MAG: HAD family hydrolase [Planctomycetota bacterium]